MLRKYISRLPHERFLFRDQSNPSLTDNILPGSVLGDSFRSRLPVFQQPCVLFVSHRSSGGHQNGVMLTIIVENS